MDSAAPATPIGQVEAPDLAAQIAARLCHDFISPASAIVSGLDLLEDPSANDMRDDAMKLIETSAKKLVAVLAFARVAFGASASAETFDTRDLQRLTQGVYDHVRPDLEWAVDLPSLNKPAARALLNLAQIAATALPTGGKAKVFAKPEENGLLLGVEAEGARCRVRPEVLSGLKGEPLGDGLGGHWVQAYYLYALAAQAGGTLAFEVEDTRAVFAVRLPLEPSAQ